MGGYAVLTTPQFRVVLDVNGEELNEYEVRAVNMDMVAFDRERARMNWPGADVAPMLWATYVAWRAMTRLGHTQLRWPEFEEHALQVEVLQDKVSEVDPTRTAVAAE